jgi:hypothetical protein
MATQTDDRDKKTKTSLGKWLLTASFVGLSGFILISELLDSVSAVEGNLFLIKILASILAGVAGFVAASHSGLLRQGK